MAQTTIPAYLAALKTLLEARAGIIGPPAVKIFTAHPGDELPPEAVVFDRVAQSQVWAAVGRQRRDESYTLVAVIHIEKTGAGEAIAKIVRERAYDILDEVDEAIRADPQVSSTVRVSRVAGAELRQGTGDRKRWAELEVRVDVDARI